MDFEFTSFQGNMVLISGAMSKFQLEARVFKLQGRPLVFNRQGNVVLFNMYKQHMLINHVRRTFRTKLDKLDSILHELHCSLSTPRSRSNLYPEFIFNYLNNRGQRPILVLWNGSSDVDILRKMDIYVPITLNLTAYDDNNDYQFYLKLFNYDTDELICSYNIGRVVKKGRMLSLDETHSCINCYVDHESNILHDPVVDVEYTKCIFNHLMRLEGYNKILGHAVRHVKSANS